MYISIAGLVVSVQGWLVELNWKLIYMEKTYDVYQESNNLRAMQIQIDLFRLSTLKYHVCFSKEKLDTHKNND